MHFGFLSIGLLSGITAAIAAFSLSGSMFFAILCYAFFSFTAVCFGALIWAISPTHIPAPTLVLRPSPNLGAEHDP